MAGESFDFIPDIPLPRIVPIDTEVLPGIWPAFCRKQGILIHAVVMYENPVANQKLFPAAGVIAAGIREGLHLKTDTIIDSTSGNFGVALAYVVKEIRRRQPDFPITRVIAVVPKSLPQGKQARLSAAGVELVFAKDSLDAMVVARELAAGKGYWYTEQYWNEANSDSYLQVGAHIVQSLPNLGALACGVGSGGSLSGVMKGIEKLYGTLAHRLHCVAVAVEPGSKVPGVRDSVGLEPGTLPWRTYADDIRYFGTDTALQFSHALVLV